MLPSRNMDTAEKETDIKTTFFWRWGGRSLRDT